MPVFNCQPYLDQAIDSILDQSFTDFELIIVNDGSTDGTLSIAKRFFHQDARITIVDTPNRGIAAATNAGLAIAKGELIARMDGDDISVPDRFQKQADYLAQNGDVIAVGAQVMLMDPHGRRLVMLPIPTDHDEIDAAHMKGDAAMFQGCVTFRAAALEKVMGYREEHIAEDIDLWLQLAEVGQLTNLEDTLLLYRQHATSTGYTKRREQMLSCWKAGQDAAARRGQSFNVPLPSEVVLTRKKDVFLRWGWWALQGGNIQTARHYALKSLFLSPLSLEAWRLAYCVLIKGSGDKNPDP